MNDQTRLEALKLLETLRAALTRGEITDLAIVWTPGPELIGVHIAYGDSKLTMLSALDLARDELKKKLVMEIKSNERAPAGIKIN